MNETEQLKQQAHQEFKEERMQELNKYIHETYLQILQTSIQSSKAMIVNMGVAVLWSITIFTNSQLAFVVGWLAWLFSYIFYFTKKEKHTAKCAEFDGAFNTVKILGNIDESDIPGLKRKKKKYKQSMIAKIWEKTKQLTQRKAYGKA